MGRAVSAIAGRLRMFAQPMTLQVKLGLMMLIPLLALLAFAGGAVNDKWSDRTEARDARQGAELTSAIGHLVHELQLERGRSGMAVAAGSGDLGLILEEQRAAADVAYDQFLRVSERFGVAVDDRFRDVRLSIRAQWVALRFHRQTLDAGGMSSDQAMRSYTSLIEDLLDLTVHSGVVEPRGTRDSLLSAAHWDFLSGKEQAALVRGKLGTAAAAGDLTDEVRAEIEDLVREEEVYFHSFQERAPSETLLNYEEMLDSSEMQAALELRAQLLSTDLIATSADAGVFFESLTAQIDGLLVLEEQITREIQSAAVARESSAELALVLDAAGAGLLLVVSFVVLTLGARSIARPLRQLAESAQLIANGDLEAEPSEWPDDAIGEIGVAFEQMRAYLREMAEAAEEVAWGDFDVEVEPRSAADTFGHSIAAMTRRLSLMMVESEVRAEELEGMVQRLRESEEELRQTATHDGLTGLPNRAHFMERLEVELERARRAGSEVGVAFIDLNKFKAVNDTLGHHAGDTLLEMVAERLRTEIRTSDTAARLGGDEFALILPDLHKTPAPDELLTRLVNALSVPYELHDKEVDCPPSMGVAFSPVDAQGADLLLAKADHAMYEAKRQGGGAYRFWSATDPQSGIAV